MKEYGNEKYNESAYDIIVGSSMWAYISHYIFIVLSANYFVRPFGISYEGAILSNLLLTWIGIFITYFILCYLEEKYKAMKDLKKQALMIHVRKNLKEECDW